MCEWHLEEDTKEAHHDFKGSANGEEAAKTNKAAVEMANTFNLGVDGNDTQELLEVVPKELTNE